MRIVLDTNVLISALINRSGAPGLLLDLWHSGAVTVVTSIEQRVELLGVLSRPNLQRFIRADEVSLLVEQLDSVAEILTDLPEVRVSSDPKDNYVLAMAIAGKADLLVTGDAKHLLPLGDIDGVPIVTVADALDRLRR